MLSIQSKFSLAREALRAVSLAEEPKAKGGESNTDSDVMPIDLGNLFISLPSAIRQAIWRLAIKTPRLITLNLHMSRIVCTNPDAITAMGQVNREVRKLYLHYTWANAIKLFPRLQPSVLNLLRTPDEDQDIIFLQGYFRACASADDADLCLRHSVDVCFARVMVALWEVVECAMSDWADTLRCLDSFYEVIFLVDWPPTPEEYAAFKIKAGPLTAASDTELLAARRLLRTERIPVSAISDYEALEFVSMNDATEVPGKIMALLQENWMGTKNMAGERVLDPQRLKFARRKDRKLSHHDLLVMRKNAWRYLPDRPRQCSSCIVRRQAGTMLPKSRSCKCIALAYCVDEEE